MKVQSVAAILALIVSVATSGAAPKPVVLQPAGAWNLRYDDQACRLVRQFGSADEGVTFTLAMYTATPPFELILAGKQMEPRGEVLRYRFVPSDEFEQDKKPLFGTNPQGVTSWQLSADLLGEKRRFALGKLSVDSIAHAHEMATKARLDSITAFEVATGMERAFVLATGPLDKPFAALETCLDDLIASWGFDPAIQRTLVSRPDPKSSPSSWISSSNYPVHLLGKNISGLVRFRLDVGADGLPKKCVVQAAFSDPDFEKVTCDNLMRRARFEPAKDRTGAGVPSYWVSSVKWLSS